MPVSKKELVARTVADLRETRPHLAELLDAFEPLWLARAEETMKLEKRIAELGTSLPERSEDLESRGISLLATADLSTYWPLVVEAAKSFEPVYEANPRLMPHLFEVHDFFAREREAAFGHGALKSVLESDEGRFAELSELDQDAAASLYLATEYAFSTVLQALASSMGATDDEGKQLWPLWSRGYCPVCGRLPTMDWLGKGYEELSNPYLITGGGRKFLHCGMCGSDWRFRRAVCPACGSEEKGVMGTFYDVTNQCEHVSYCSECSKYTVGLDLRAISPIPDLDIMAFAMMPLDIRAAEQGLFPMCRTVWNSK